MLSFMSRYRASVGVAVLWVVLAQAGLGMSSLSFATDEVASFVDPAQICGAVPGEAQSGLPATHHDCGLCGPICSLGGALPNDSLTLIDFLVSKQATLSLAFLDEARPATVRFLPNSPRAPPSLV
ncbi:MAG: hypothetical protein A2516_05625 [Alphaproteobacteria bacterium RIFOXYD12_FULL_60_8]|nr:MAG: hypothetical protein A2516_05625 [Alphaproteobacteria bacterium RIFOXYD12_FULL_60_8]